MKIIRFILLLFHLGILGLLLLTLLNSVVSPEVFPYLNLLSLAFPVFMILNVLLCLLWIILWKKKAIFFVGMSLILINPTQRWLNYKPKNTEVSDLKIVSFNIKSGTLGREKIYDYLENSGADLIVGQEYGSEFNIPGYPHRTNEAAIVATNSKTEILKMQSLDTRGNGNAIYTDIKIKGKIIRIINIYLNPFSFDKDKIKPAQSLDKNEVKAKYVLRTLIPTFKIHQKEVVAIREAIDASPYPVIVAGDFNAVPNSYEYYAIGKNLTDAFVAVGRGSSTSFHDYKFPIRIDYIFASKEIKPIRYRVDRSVKLSDHFPVIAEFKIN